METPVPVPRKAFAVVCTGLISGDADIVLFQGAEKQRYPVTLFAHEDKAVCERKKTTIAKRASDIRLFDAPNMQTSQLILGVVPIVLPAKQPKREMSEAQKAAMQAGRKKAEPAAKVPVVAGSHPTAKK